MTYVMLLLRGEKLTLSYKLKSLDGRATFTMSYDDRMMVVRCYTILDSVLRRRTIIDKVVVARLLHKISYYEHWCRVTSYDIVRSSYDIPHEWESQKHDQKLPRYREIDPPRWLQRRAMSHD